MRLSLEPPNTAVSGERVWGVSGANSVPPTAYTNAVYNLGPAYEGCVVDYVGIDDDINGVRNGFWIGSELLEIIVEGMTFQGDFVIPYDSTQFRLVAEEVNSIALWYNPCTDTNPPGPTATPDPSLLEKLFLPFISNEEAEPDPTATPIPVPDSYTLECDPNYDISIVDEEVHFQFSATAFLHGDPYEGIDLKGTLATGEVSPTNVENTNFNGVADFTMTVLVTQISQSPVATVTFNDPTTYGNDSCTINFSAPNPTPTPTVPPQSDYDVVCDQDYEIHIHEEEVDFEFSAIAYLNGNPLEDVDLKGTLDTGGATMPSNVEETNFNGVADFNMTVLITAINQTPLATITFNDQGTYGNASCTVSFSSNSEMNLLLASIND